MTSLSQQLQRLAIPFTQTIFSADKKRSSLLFDPKEAATLDKEAVYAIGLGGLEELQNVEAQFMEFESTLFNLASQNWERGLQTAEVNQQLDDTIRRFLILLSPYFPLKSAHKTLEWLIYRYHIHQFNRDDLILCIMPYHEMKIFVRVLQLVKLDDATDKWNWLEPSVKNGLPLARGTLINHCSKDPGFMSFILEMVPAFIKVHGVASSQLRAILALYTCSLLGTLQNEANITERIMSVIVPHLVKGFKSKCAEYKAANYMVLSQLVVQTPLQESLLTTLLPVITKHLAPRLLQEALLCLSLVFQTQKITSMPKKSFKHMCKVPGIISLLSSLSRQYDLDKLVLAWAQRLIPQAVELGDSGSYSSSDGADDGLLGKPPYFTLLQGLLSEVNLVHSETKVHIARLILRHVMERREKITEAAGVIEWKQQTVSLLSLLENRHSEALDGVAQEVMASALNDEESLEALQEVMSLTFSPIKYEAIPDTETNVFLGLKHHSPHVRILTLGHLSKYISGNHGNQGREADFLEDLLLERLHDDEPSVVSAVLNMNLSLTKMINQEKLMVALQVLLKKITGTKSWITVQSQALHVLCDLSATNHGSDISLDLLPFLLVLDQASIESAEIILNRCAGLMEEAFSACKPKWKRCAGTKRTKGDVLVNLNQIILESFQQFLQKQSTKDSNRLVTEMIQRCEDQPLYQFFLLCVLNDFVTETKVKETTIESLLDLLRMTKPKMTADLTPMPMTAEAYGSEALMTGWIQTLRDCEAKRLPLSLGVACGFSLAKSLNRFHIQESSLFHVHSTQLTAHVVRFMDMLLKNTDSRGKCWRAVLLYLIDQLPFQTTVYLTFHIWTTFMDSKPGGISPILHVGSHYILRHVLEHSSPEQTNMICDPDKPVLVGLLLSLLDPHPSVRHAAIDCLHKLHESAADTLGVHQALVARVLRQQQEIIADAEHTPYVVGRLFSKVNAPADSPGKSKKSETRLQCLECLIHWITVPDTCIQLVMKHRLMELISQVPHTLVVDKLLPVADNILRQCVAAPGEVDAGHMTLLADVLARFDEDTADTLACKGRTEVTLTTALTTCAGPAACPSPQIMALKQITHGFFHRLPRLEIQHKIVTTLLDAAVKSSSGQFSSECNSCLKKLKLDGRHVAHELEIKEPEISTVKGRKKTRTNKDLLELDYRRLTLLLEVLHVRKKIREAEALAVLLFSLLSRLQQDDLEDTEYTKQLVLGIVLKICKHWDQDTKPPTQESLSIESLVACIRTSASPHTQQQAMMVMSAIAPLYPEYILHNVMSIFTFMGTSLLPQDDAYTFQLITSTLDTIIPAIIKACSDKGTEADSLIENILRVFIDARHHIPKHRSTMLFHQLSERVGAQRHLWTVLVLLLESSVRTRNVPEVSDVVTDITEEGRTLIDKDIDLAVNICSQFEVELQVQTVSRILGFLKSLTNHLVLHPTQPAQGAALRKKTKMAHSVPVISMETISVQQLRLTEYHVTRVIVALLSHNNFVTAVLERSTEGRMTPEFGSHFRELVAECLDLLTNVAKGYNKYSNTSTGKFWRAVMHKIYDVLDKVNYLLPCSMFLTVVSSLLSHDSVAICRKSLELLNNKLQAVTMDTIQDSEVSALLRILPDVVAVVASDGPTDPEPDVVALQQMALYSLKLMCKLLGQIHPKDFSQMLMVTKRILSAENAPLPVTSSALLCLAELCASLKAQVLPHLSTFMPRLVTIISDVPLLQRQELLLVCSLTALQKIVGTLPQFLAPYLLDVVLNICRISCFVDLSPATKKSQACLRLRAVRHQISTALAPRVLIPVLSKSLESLREADQKALIPLFEITEEHVEFIDKSELPSHQVALVSYFCDCLDIRNSSLTISFDEAMAVEEKSLGMILSLVMRLSEVSFRPMFYKLYDWACRDDDNTYRNRQLSFFRLAERLSDRLRGLFNLFIGHAIKTACNLLNKNNTMHGDVSYYGSDPLATRKSCLLTEYIIGCLHKCFLHDTEHFVDKEMFSSLVQPLVDQLENMIGGDVTYQNRICSHVTPCISQLAVASTDDSSWKVLNYQVLLKTRHESPKVRFATLQTVEALANKLGDEYMTLLPETVPFLAELMEDDSEEVEQKCQQVVSSLEQLLGESIQQYF